MHDPVNHQPTEQELYERAYRKGIKTAEGLALRVRLFEQDIRKSRLKQSDQNKVLEYLKEQLDK